MPKVKPVMRDEDIREVVPEGRHVRVSSVSDAIGSQGVGLGYGV